MVHSSQVSADITFSREDEDDMKGKTMDFYASPGSEVGMQVHHDQLYRVIFLPDCHACAVSHAIYPLQIWVKVIDIREEGNGNFKLACSMKVRDCCQRL